MKQDLSREQVLASALEDYRKNLPTPDNDVPKTDWSKIETYGGWDRRPLNVYNNNTTYTKVTCKDGTIQNQPSSPTAKYDDACRNNGGIDNQKQYEDALKNEQAKAQVQANSQANNTKEPIYYILVTAGVLIAGYFAYKKFKK